jgi:predicted nucleotidyltransferase component of viral defense system
LIPAAYIQEWSHRAPWPDSRQIEQDLIICRALCDLFNSPALAGKIAFRGGTAIHKLLFRQPLRYSEDIDLVQTRPEPIGPMVDATRDALSWLGPCRRSQAGHSMHLVFKYTPEAHTDSTLKLKIEINTREHTNFCGVKRYPFQVDSRWYRASTEIVSFEPEELFATKFRALLQRRKNRDLFDLNEGLNQLSLDIGDVVRCFQHYISVENNSITRAIAEQRMLEKLTRSLTEDIVPLLPAGVEFSDEDAVTAFNRVWTELITRIDGEPWKRTEEVVEELRQKLFPDLLKHVATESPR